MDSHNQGKLIIRDAQKSRQSSLDDYILKLINDHLDQEGESERVPFSLAAIATTKNLASKIWHDSGLQGVWAESEKATMMGMIETAVHGMRHTRFETSRQKSAAVSCQNTSKRTVEEVTTDEAEEQSLPPNKMIKHDNEPTYPAQLQIKYEPESAPTAAPGAVVQYEALEFEDLLAAL